jgi:hypothetical protein
VVAVLGRIVGPVIAATCARWRAAEVIVEPVPNRHPIRRQMKMQIPGLGNVARDPQRNRYASEPVEVPVLGGISCRIMVEDDDDDPCREAIHAAIARVLSASPQVLREAGPHLFRYWRDCGEYVPDPRIASPGDVWAHLRLGHEPVVSRRPHGAPRVCISVEGACGWKDDHGLQIVFEEGARVARVGPCDGHLTTAYAYGDARRQGVVYRGAS